MQKLDKAPISTGAASTYPYSAGLEAALTFETKYAEKVCMARREGDRLLVPRQLAPSPGIDFRINRPVPAIDCKVPPLDKEQAYCIGRSLELLRLGKDHVLEAPTGWGKTYGASAVAAALGQVTLILVQKEDLMGQWRDTLVNLIGVPPSEIGIAQADKLEYKGKRFVLGMVQSVIIPGKYDSDFYEAFGLVIFDETHRMAAECFSRACFLLPARHRLGCSATPKRNDGKTPVVEAHIGPVLVKGTTVPMAPKVLVQETGWRVPPWIEKVDPGRMMPVFNAMVGAEKRNSLIVKFVLDAFAAGRTTVLISDTIKYLDQLQKLIGAAGVSGENFGEYIGEHSKKKELLKINANKPVVFATYGMVAEGTNYKHWDTEVMVTPRVNVKQPLGRILRSREGKKTPVLLDLVDDGPIFRAFYRKRETQYHSVGGKIVHMRGSK